MILFQFDVGTVGLLAGILLFVVFAAAAYVAFRLLKKTAKLAFRMAVVVAILAIGVVGAISFYWFGTGTTGGTAKPKPASTRTK